MIDSNYDVSKLANFRDLGGLELSSGLLADKTLFRSDDLSTINPDEAQRVAETGVKLIIDLRSKAEAETSGRGELANYPIEYLNLPLLDFSKQGQNISDRVRRENFSNQMLGNWYAKVMQDVAPMLVEGITAVAETSGSVVFHCAIGKDRTGIFAASILTLMGVSQHQVVEDFTKTEQNLPQILARLSRSQPFWTPELISQSGALVRAEPEAMNTMFDSLAAENTSVQEILGSAGVTGNLIQKLIQKHSRE